MPQALQRFVLHWDTSAKPPGFLLLVPHSAFSFWGILSTPEHFQFLFWIPPCCSVLLRSDWLYWGTLGIITFSISGVASRFLAPTFPMLTG